MKQRDFDPLHLDVASLARSQGRLGGAWPLRGFTRLADVLAARADEAMVNWSAQGLALSSRAQEPEIWLELRASAQLALTCQRCLEPCDCVVEIDRRFRFVADETEAEALDAEAEHDVLALGRELDLHQLVEDELLLAMPLVPRHDSCPRPLTEAGDPATGQAESPHPFAALATLRRPPTA